MIKVRGQLPPLLSYLPTVRASPQQRQFPKQLPFLRRIDLLLTPKDPRTAFFPASVFSRSYVPVKPVKDCRERSGVVFGCFLFGRKGNAVFHCRTLHSNQAWLQEATIERQAEGFSSSLNAERRELSDRSAARLRRSKNITSGNRISTKGRFTTSDLITKARIENIAEAEVARSRDVHDTQNGQPQTGQRQTTGSLCVLEKREDGFGSTKNTRVPKFKPQHVPAVKQHGDKTFLAQPASQQLQSSGDKLETRVKVIQRKALWQKYAGVQKLNDSLSAIEDRSETFDHSYAVSGPDKARKEDPNSLVYDRSSNSKRSERNGELQSHRQSTEVASRNPFNRFRQKVGKHKNELTKKDLSVKPIPGESHEQYKIRRNRATAEARIVLKDDVDCKQAGDDWVRKRLGWLCKEIPVLKASGIVKILNTQKKWIKQEHIRGIVEHLVKMMELNRAHRALKWMQQQTWYKFDYELHNNIAYILGRNDKVSRTQDVFDEIIRNGMVPEASTFTVLIKAYVRKGDSGDIDNALKLYNQMMQLEMKTSSSLLEALFEGLTCPTGRWLQQAEQLLEKMKTLGYHISEEMYERLVEIHGKQGKIKRVESLIQEMRGDHLEIGIRVLNSVLAACAKDGNVGKAETTLKEITKSRLEPDWRSYVYLMKAYGAAGLHMKSWEIFQKMKEKTIPVNVATYHTIIDLMANGLQTERVLQLLTEAENSGCKPMQPCFNSVMNMYLRLKMYEEVESVFNRGKAARARPGHVAYNMLIKAYRDGGHLEKAESVFQQMKIKGGIGANTHSYNLMLEGYGVACLRDKVKEIFQEMLDKGCQVDAHVKVHIQSMVGVKRLALLEKEKLKLTMEQREVIPGLLLGGAKMESPDKNRTYELHLGFNCENRAANVLKDHVYLLFQSWWKQNQTAECGAEESLMEGRTKNHIQLETVNHGSFRFYAHQYRPKGDPVIPKLIHRWLKPRTLAYWYMYGGRKCHRTGGIVLNASKYSGKQIQLVVKALKARTMDCRRKKKRNGDVIRFEGKSSGWLWKLMEPYILDELKDGLMPEEVPVNLAIADNRNLGISDEESSDEECDWEHLVLNQFDEIACS